MTRTHKYARDRKLFTPEELDLMRRLMDEAEQRRGRVKWAEYQYEIGHPLSSIRSMASFLRERHRAKQDQDRRRALRMLFAAVTSDDGRKTPPLQRQTQCQTDEHLVNTSTQSLLFAAQMRSLIGDRGITAGLLGDPLPGRSALDRKRAGIVEPKERYRGDPWVPRPATLASHADEDSKKRRGPRRYNKCRVDA